MSPADSPAAVSLLRRGYLFCGADGQSAAADGVPTGQYCIDQGGNSGIHFGLAGISGEFMCCRRIP